jgi:hypothetical protein
VTDAKDEGDDANEKKVGQPPALVYSMNVGVQFGLTDATSDKCHPASRFRARHIGPPFSTSRSTSERYAEFFGPRSSGSPGDFRYSGGLGGGYCALDPAFDVAIDH